MKQQALTGPAWKGVYGAIRDHFHLSAAQRDRLDESPLYYRAMAFALSARTAASRLDYDAAETAWREVEATLTEICRCPTPPAGIEPAETTGRTAADEYEGACPETRQFLSAFEV